MSAASPACRIRGAVLRPLRDRAGFTLMPDAILDVDAQGRIASIGPAAEGEPLPETEPGALWMPGFVDAHVHYPQTRMVGSASGPLLDWLEKTTFPEEARFADRAYAEAVAEDFCAALVAQGTTAAAIFGSPHPGATDVLFAALDRWGLRALAGMTLMDRGAPPPNLMAAGPALQACEALIARWHGHDGGRLSFCVTPRFAIACTPELLAGAAALVQRHDLPMQTHLSENAAEIAYTMELFPDSADYLGVYADHGLLGPRALFAHGIHLSDGEWGRLAASGAALAHCPDSNFFLGSGAMRLAHALRLGIRVGLGTDVGGGRSFSVRRCAARAYDAALLVGEPVNAESLLWQATRGGALALGQGDRIGLLEPGFDADLVAVDRPEAASTDALWDALLFRLDFGPVRQARVRGRVLSAPTSC